jgi:spore germination protein YaaH
MKKLLAFLFLSIFSFQNLFALETLWYLKNQDRSLNSFKNNYDKIDIVGPQVYFLKKDGVITGKVPDVVLNINQKKKGKLKVMPLLANITFTKAGKEYFDRTTVSNLLENPKNWEKVSKFMREEAYNNNFYGWQLDLENIDVKNKENLNKFVKYLKGEFDKDGLKLSIAVVSKISDQEKDYAVYEKNQPGYYKYWAGVYDYKTLGETADFISLMIYDEPNSPGPVATLGWSKKVIEYATKNIQQEKISFGIPVYGWAYRSGEKKMFSMVDFPFTAKIITNFDKRDAKNMTTGEGMSKIYGNIPWVSYNKFGKNYTIWYEDKLSFQTKLEQIKKLAPNALGISMWVIGDEDPLIWSLF